MPFLKASHAVNGSTSTYCTYDWLSPILEFWPSSCRLRGGGVVHLLHLLHRVCALHCHGAEGNTMKAKTNLSTTAASKRSDHINGLREAGGCVPWGCSVCRTPCIRSGREKKSIEIVLSVQVRLQFIVTRSTVLMRLCVRS